MHYKVQAVVDTQEKKQSHADFTQWWNTLVFKYKMHLENNYQTVSFCSWQTGQCYILFFADLSLYRFKHCFMPLCFTCLLLRFDLYCRKCIHGKISLGKIYYCCDSWFALFFWTPLYTFYNIPSCRNGLYKGRDD